MAARNLPANELLTSGHFRNWVIKESVGVDEANAHIYEPSADQAYQQYDMIILGERICGITDQAAEAGEPVHVYAAQAIQVDTAQIEAGSNFNTMWQDVWYDPVTKLYCDTQRDGVYRVGYVTIPVNVNGIFRFEKKRYVDIGEGS